jgi:hypothetical protein
MPRSSVQVKGPPALVIAVLTALLALGAGGFAAWWSSDRRALAQDSASFIPVPAVVQSTSVQEHHSSRRGTRYSPIVRYSYEVDGRSHEGDTFAAWAPRFRTEADLHAAMGQLGIRPGATVEALHDPDNPARAVLSREVDQNFILGMWGLTAAGAVFVAVGGWMLGGLAFNPGFRSKIMGRT